MSLGRSNAGLFPETGDDDEIFHKNDERLGLQNDRDSRLDDEASIMAVDGQWEVSRNKRNETPLLPDIVRRAIIISKETDDTNFILDYANIDRPHSQSSSSTISLYDVESWHPSNTAPVDPKLQWYYERYGSELTANFLEIRRHGAKAFVTTEDFSDGYKYSLCTCATGYIWIRILPQSDHNESPWQKVHAQIGTLALSTRLVTLTSVEFEYKVTYEEDIKDGKLALLCATIMAKYLCLRMSGAQYEEAAESALRETREELSAFRIVDPAKYVDFRALLLGICKSAPTPPVSIVSEVSREMIYKPWRLWSDGFQFQRWTWRKKVKTALGSSQETDAIDLIDKVVRRSNPDG